MSSPLMYVQVHLCGLPFLFEKPPETPLPSSSLGSSEKEGLSKMLEHELCRNMAQEILC